MIQFGDYVFFNASLKGISPLDGFKQFLSNSSSSTKINFAQGCELWSNDDSGFADAVHAAQSSDVAIVMVRYFLPNKFIFHIVIPPRRSELGLSTKHCYGLLELMRQQVNMLICLTLAWWGPSLALFKPSRQPENQPLLSSSVGNQSQNHGFKQVREFAVFLSISHNRLIFIDADAVIQQFYPGELGGNKPVRFGVPVTKHSTFFVGLAIAEIIFGAVNPSGKVLWG